MNDLFLIKDDADFEEKVINASNNQLVIVDFYADWCSPCKAMTNILKETAVKYGEKLKIVKIDVDKFPSKSAEFNVRGIPTLILFKQKKLVETKVGLIEKNKLWELIEKEMKDF